MLTIIRGLPGSGKSTQAKKLGCLHIEADMYHVREGLYSFEDTRKKDAHDWCLDFAIKALSKGMDVVVSNTFTQFWEILPYIEAAKTFKQPYEIIRMVGEWGSVHNVPQEVIERMKARFESIEGEKEINATQEVNHAANNSTNKV